MLNFFRIFAYVCWRQVERNFSPMPVDDRTFDTTKSFFLSDQSPVPALHKTSLCQPPSMLSWTSLNRFWHGCHSGSSLWNLESGWLGASLETSPIKRGAADVARRHTGGLGHVLGHLGVPHYGDPCHPVFRGWQCRDVSKTRPLLNTDNAEMWP